VVVQHEVIRREGLILSLSRSIYSWFGKIFKIYFNPTTENL